MNNEEKILQKLDQHDGQFDRVMDKLDKHDKQFDRVMDKLDQHDKQFDRVITKLVEHDGEFEKIKDTMTSKDVVSEIMRGQDKMIQILLRVDQERVFTNEKIRQLDADVKQIKLQLQIA